jgi:hypothetical protein
MILVLLDLSTALCRIAVDRDPYSAKLEPKGPSHDRVTRFMNGGALPVISFVHAIVNFAPGTAGLIAHSGFLCRNHVARSYRRSM